MYHCFTCVCLKINFSKFAQLIKTRLLKSLTHIQLPLVGVTMRAKFWCWMYPIRLSDITEPCVSPMRCPICTTHTLSTLCGSVIIHKYVSSLLSQPPPWMEITLSLISVAYQIQLKSIKKYIKTNYQYIGILGFKNLNIERLTL